MLLHNADVNVRRVLLRVETNTYKASVRFLYRPKIVLQDTAVMQLGALQRDGLEWVQEFQMARAPSKYTLQRRLFVFAEDFYEIYLLMIQYE